jgi:hypothetical protein
LQIGRMLDIDLISEPPSHPLPPDVCIQSVRICVARGAGSDSIASWGLRMSHICPCTPCPSPQGYRSKVESRHFAHHWPVASPESTTLHSTGNNSVKKEVGHSNTRGTVRLCSTPAEILLHIVYIFNILCGLKVINSRRLQ